VAIALIGGNFDQAGKVSSRGIDFDAIGDLKHGIRVNLNYGYSDPRFDVYFASNGTVSLVGKRPNFTSRHALNIWASKDWRSSFTSSIGFRYQSLSFIDNANTFRLGGYSVFQGAFSYRRKLYDLSVNAENLFDRQRYFPSGLYQNQVYPGPPINAYVTVRFHK
jgi:iron complex outermembrane receptor protein